MEPLSPFPVFPNGEDISFAILIKREFGSKIEDKLEINRFLIKFDHKIITEILILNLIISSRIILNFI